MTLKTQNSAAHLLLTRILTRELIGRADLALLLDIDESKLDRYESGARQMSLSLQWKLAAVVIASLSHIPDVRRRAHGLRAQLIAVSTYNGGDTQAHVSSPPFRFG